LRQAETHYLQLIVEETEVYKHRVVDGLMVEIYSIRLGEAQPGPLLNVVSRLRNLTLVYNFKIV
jgi:hypothetical protein